MSYAVRNDGHGWRAVNEPDDVGPDETYSETLPVLTPSPTDEIRQQIVELESTVTPRRIREAVLGTDNGWLASVDAQIKALRAQLTHA